MQIVTVSNSSSQVPSKSHNYWFHKGLEEAAAKIGLTYTTLGPRTSVKGRPSTLPELSFAAQDHPISSLLTNLKLNEDVRTLSAIVSKDSKDSLIFIYEGGLREFFLTLRTLSENTNIKVAFNFNFADAWHHLFDGRGIMSAIARRRLRAILDLAGNRIIRLAETLELAEHYSNQIGVSFSECPIFSGAEFGNFREMHADFACRRHPVVFFPANDFEAMIVLSALERLTKEGIDLADSLLVSRWGYEPSPEILHKCHQIGVRVMTHLLSPDEYAAALGNSRLAIFPYLDPVYKWSSSMRLLEAASLGTPSLCPKDSVPGKMALRKNWGGVFTSSDLSVKIGQFIERPHGLAGEKPLSADDALRQLLRLKMESEEGVSLAPIPPKHFGLRNQILLRLGTGIRQWLPKLFFSTRFAMSSRSRVK